MFLVDTAAIIDVLGVAANLSRPYAFADPDLLMTGGAGCDLRVPGLRCPGSTDVEYKTEFIMWAVGAAPLVVSTDVRKMSNATKAILLHEEILAINQVRERSTSFLCAIFIRTVKLEYSPRQARDKHRKS